MVITYPRTDIFDIVGFATSEFRLIARNQTTRQQDGRTRSKRLGPQYWVGSWQSVPKRHDIILDLESALNSLEDGVFPFYAADLRRLNPREYPSGSFADTAKLGIINANNKQIIVTNAQPGFKISRGDYFSFDYSDSSGGTYRYYGQVMNSVVCDSNGISPDLEVRPHLSSWVTVGTDLTFHNPRGAFKLVNGSVNVQQADPLNSTIQFDAFQCLRINDL